MSNQQMDCIQSIRKAIEYIEETIGRCLENTTFVSLFYLHIVK